MDRERVIYTAWACGTVKIYHTKSNLQKPLRVYWQWERDCEVFVSFVYKQWFILIDHRSVLLVWGDVLLKKIHHKSVLFTHKPVTLITFYDTKLWFKMSNDIRDRQNFDKRNFQLYIMQHFSSFQVGNISMCCRLLTKVCSIFNCWIAMACHGISSNISFGRE